MGLFLEIWLFCGLPLLMFCCGYYIGTRRVLVLQWRVYHMQVKLNALIALQADLTRRIYQPLEEAIKEQPKPKPGLQLVVDNE